MSALRAFLISKCWQKMKVFPRAIWRLILLGLVYQVWIKKRVMEILLSNLVKDDWTLATTHDLGDDINNAYHFTGPVQTS